ncbi:MAG: DUF222 domain-containing protein, partial [Bdellovibrionaceae bacterium]|nr:DUF222 domain-containing protein [Pseudobdellovibrionaceae bacterium]
MNFQNLKERDALPAKLKSYDDSKLISQFDHLVKTERKITFHILSHINEMERRRLPAQLGYPSTHMYLVKAHGYSEASAQRRIQSARLLRQIPEVGESIVAGRLNMTQLSQVQMMVRQKQ